MLTRTETKPAAEEMEAETAYNSAQEVAIDELLSGMNLSGTANTNQSVLRASLPRNFEEDGLKFDYVQESDATTFLVTLQNVGSLIKKLDIKFSLGGYGNQSQNILAMLAEKCAFSLTELAVSNFTNITLNHTLPSVRKLTYYDNRYAMNQSWAAIHRYFPNVHTFEMKHVKGFSESFINHVPNLREFTYIPSPNCAPDVHDIHRLAQFLNLNPQISRLHLDIFDDGQLQQQLQSNINWDIMKVQRFRISADTLHLSGILRIKQLKSLSISASLYHTNHDILKNVNTTLDELEVDIYFRDYAVLNFIASCRNLKKLKMNLYAPMEFRHLQHLINYLPQLTDITFQVFAQIYENECEVAEGVFKFMEKCNNLQSANVVYAVSFITIEIDKCQKYVCLYQDLKSKFPHQNWKMSHGLKHDRLCLPQFHVSFNK